MTYNQMDILRAGKVIRLGRLTRAYNHPDYPDLGLPVMICDVDGTDHPILLTEEACRLLWQKAVNAERLDTTGIGARTRPKGQPGIELLRQADRIHIYSIEEPRGDVDLHTGMRSEPEPSFITVIVDGVERSYCLDEKVCEILWRKASNPALLARTEMGRRTRSMKLSNNVYHIDLGDGGCDYCQADDLAQAVAWALQRHGRYIVQGVRLATAEEERLNQEYITGVGPEPDDDRENLEDALRRIKAWALDAYPEDLFPEANLSDVHLVLVDHGISLGSVTATILRRALRGIGRIAADALGEESDDER